KPFEVARRFLFKVPRGKRALSSPEDVSAVPPDADLPRGHIPAPASLSSRFPEERGNRAAFPISHRDPNVSIVCQHPVQRSRERAPGCQGSQLPLCRVARSASPGSRTPTHAASVGHRQGLVKGSAQIRHKELSGKDKGLSFHETPSNMAEATLKGFSSFLDWKLLTFQRSLPRAFTCDLCGLVSQTSMVAACMHAFCLDFNQLLLVEPSPKCPLDAREMNPDESKQFVLGDVERDKLLVRCMNAPHGCDFCGPLFDLENHFVKNCNFHMVSCKACGGPVLRNEVLEHLNACGLQDKGSACIGTQSSISEEKLKFDHDNGVEINALAAIAVMCT
ncbi:hypothetical protein HPB47_019680, partial [Ixodes persulcatus]